uniref:Uncharacterized protein n=1 Tax=Cucumis melo TaxID=3656 RepID=A0A9I9EBR0_CUCME
MEISELHIVELSPPSTPKLKNKRDREQKSFPNLSTQFLSWHLEHRRLSSLLASRGLVLQDPPQR